MYQINPLILSESKKQLLKRLSRYTSDQQAKIRDKMLALGKKNGGWYSADQYAKKMKDGQIKRVKKLADRSGRQITINEVPSALASNTRVTTNNDVIKAQRYIGHRRFYTPGDRLNQRNLERGIMSDVINIPNNKTKPAKELINNINNDLTPDVIHQGIDHGILTKKDANMFNNLPKSAKGYHNGLARADIAAHEADEYSRVLALRKKYPNLSDSQVEYIARKMAEGTTSSHMPGVLSREFKRQKMLKSMYGDKAVAPFLRTEKEIASNRKKFNPNIKLDDIDQYIFRSLAQKGKPLTKQQALDKLQSRRKELQSIIDLQNSEDRLMKSLIDRSKKVMFARRKQMEMAYIKYGVDSKEYELATNKYLKSQNAMDTLRDKALQKYGTYESEKVNNMRSAYSDKYDKRMKPYGRKYTPYEIETNGRKYNSDGIEIFV